MATLLLLVGPVRAQSSDKLPEPVGRSIEALLAQKAQRTSAQRKVSSQLLDAAGGTQPPADGAARRRAPDPGVADELVTVDIRADVTPAVLARIRALGGTVLSSLPKYRAIRARLPLAAVEKLATLDAVQFIRPADEAITNQSLERSAVARTTGAGNERNTSEGDVAHRADVARETHDVDGTGIGIGVLSNGVDTLAERQATGDLPARVTVLAGQGGEGDEGTAMLEIVHDLAPGAELYFATILGGQAQFAANIEALCAAGADVIVDDAIYPIEPAFQDGIVAQAINAAVADDCVYFSMAGNGGNLSSYSGRRAGVWEGDYAAGSALVVSGETVGVRHDFDSGPGVAVENPVTRDSEHEFVLQWADPLGASANDYDLFLVDNNGNVLDSSTTTQDGTQDPIESIRSRRINHLGDRLVIVKVSGEDRYLRLNNVGAWFTSVTAGQTFGHNAASNAITVAAVNVTTVGGEGGVFNGTESVEWFSSDGPRRIFFRPDGTAITPSDFSSSGGQLLQKPDLTAADRVSTATPGFETFPGTSAAAPHAAAIAALMLEAAGGPANVTLDELRTAMTDAAIDIGDTGADRDSGAGIVMAPGAVEAVAVADRNGVPEASGTLASQSLAPGGATATIGVASAFTDPDSHALTYTALSDNTAVVTTSVTGSRLTLTSWGPGEAKVTVRATDPEGLSAIQIMSVTVVWGDEDYDADDDNLIEIDTLAQLNAMRHDLNGDGVVDSGADAAEYYAAFSDPEQGMGCADDCYGYELTEDLDFDTNKNGRADAGDTYWHAGKGWQPIGLYDGPPDRRGRLSGDPFTGVFDGNGHTVANLFIDRPQETGVGLFGHISRLRNVGLVNVSVTGKDVVSGLAGAGRRLDRCHVSGSVSGGNAVGGVVGRAEDVWRSYATVNVSGDSGVGGLAGVVVDAILASYATGSVTGTGSRPSDTATCESAGGVGGLVGNLCGNITASYATGPVSGAAAVGGLVGTLLPDSRIDSGYWDVTTSEVSVGVGADDTDDTGLIDGTESRTVGVAGRTAAALQAPTDYDGIFQGWNIPVNSYAIGGAPNEPWDFGTAGQYPAVRVDVDGDGRATWQEFGHQLRASPVLTATTTETPTQVVLSWTGTAGHWTPPPAVTYTLTRDNGTTIETLAEDLTALRYTDTDVTLDTMYTYQVAAVVDGGEATRSALVSVIAGAANQAPAAVGMLEERPLRIGGAEVVQLAGAFSDPDSDTLTYAATSSATAIVTTNVSGSELTLTPVAAGRATITVTAVDDGTGGSNTTVTQRFVVTVWSANGVDYDVDDDGLIEIGNLAQLDAMRHDLDGDGVADEADGQGNPAGDTAKLAAAFPNAVERMGCGDNQWCRGYELTADLDFDINKNGRADAGDAYWNGGAGWNPIRGRIISSFGLHLITSGFAATFEGNGHTIANLYINRNVTAVGLFGAAFSRAIRNVGIVNANVTGQSSVGALAGIKLGDLSGSYATGRVSGQDGVGGLVGSHRGSIAASYATTQVSGQNNVGGLIGSNYLGTVIACYATGRVSGTANVGGLVGLNSSDDEVIASYATGHVSGVSNVGGLIGDNQGTASNSYWDMSTSGQTTGTTGQTTAQLQSPTDYSGMYADWNVDLDGGGTADDPWDFGLSDEYPVLAVDFDGNEDVTWKEFGYQLRAGPTLMATPGAGEIALRWNAVDTDPWNPSPPDVTYTVYRKTDATITVLAQGISGTTYTDTGVSIGSTYTYQVAAVVEGGEATRSALVMVTAPNHPPTFLSSEDGMRTVAEKTGENVNIGDPVKATDPDDPTLTYSLGGPDAASFTITERTGQLRTKAELDHETQPLYSVTVRVSDGKDVDGTADPTVDATIPVTLTVTDAPGTVTLPSTPPLVGTMLQATLTDPDGLGSSATWKWERSRDQSVWTLIRETSTGEPANSYTPVATDINEYLRVTVQYTDGHETPDKEAGSVSQRVSARRPPPPPPPGPGPGGGGGGPACTEDDVHGNTAATATDIALSAVTAGAICPAADVDYFTVTAPGRGLLFVDTPRGVPTRGTIWQDGVVLASGPTGRQPDDRLGARVQAGSVVVAVQGQGGATGAYEVEITFVRGYLENPGSDSFQSGIGLLSGWVCEAEVVEIELNGVPQEAAYGTERLDTAGVCGDTDNGFGLLFNWNLLGDGEHTVVAWVDGVELGRATVMVTTLGQEFLRNVTRTYEAGDFPTLGERVTLVWQQNSQNFVIAGGSPPAGATTGRTSALMGFLENPGPNSFQSGVGVLSGWVCDADRVEIEIGAAGRQVAAYGTERLDTAGGCGDTDNGFGLLFNWNLLGDGEHTVVAFVDGVELGRATVRVATLGEEFLREAEGECTVTDFPVLGETVTLEWQQNSQNFVITAVE